MTDRILYRESSFSTSGSSDATSLGRFEQPCDISFEDVSYLLSSRKGEPLTVLRSVSGACRSGRLTAVMGSSGAGKSTLVRVPVPAESMFTQFYSFAGICCSTKTLVQPSGCLCSANSKLQVLTHTFTPSMSIYPAVGGGAARLGLLLPSLHSPAASL